MHEEFKIELLAYYDHTVLLSVGWNLAANCATACDAPNVSMSRYALPLLIMNGVLSNAFKSS